MCTAVPPALECRLLFSIYPWQKENKKHPIYDIFSVICVPVCITRPTKIRNSVSQLFLKLSIMDKKGRLNETPVQLVQNVHRFASCARVQVTLHSSVKSTVSVLFASVCTKDLELIWAARWSNCDQSETLSANKKSFHEMLLKPPECALLCLEQCSVALSRSCSTLFPYEYTSGKQNTRQRARFPCYLILCVHWTCNQDGMLSDRTVPKLMHFGKKKN